jgi:transposase
MTRSLLALADRLGGLGVTRVVMEATSDYWKAPFYLLEAAGFEVWLVNARDVKHLPGRPKTDRLDAVWLAKVAERQMLRPSFVPPPAIRRLRDPGPLPRRPGRGPDRRAAAGGEAARGRPDQTLGGRQRHLRGLRPRHAPPR